SFPHTISDTRRAANGSSSWPVSTRCRLIPSQRPIERASLRWTESSSQPWIYRRRIATRPCSPSTSFASFSIGTSSSDPSPTTFLYHPSPCGVTSLGHGTPFVIGLHPRQRCDTCGGSSLTLTLSPTRRERNSSPCSRPTHRVKNHHSRTGRSHSS